MPLRSNTIRKLGQPFICTILLTHVVGITAWAQNDRYGGFTSRVDAYGNAEVGFDDRRVLEVYQNQVQRNALERYQEFGRRPERRGEYSPFSFPNDVFQGARPRWLYQRPTTALTLADERTFSRFGGFGDRLGQRYGGDISTILSRRNELLRATSQTAPVRRAMMQHGMSAALPERLRSTPFLPGSTIDVTTSETHEPVVDTPERVESPDRQGQIQGTQGVETGISLTERLQSHAEASQVSAKRDAWTWFQAGEFRRAVRGFDAASALDRTDLEPQLGRFFAYAAVGAYTSALTQLRFMSRHADQPFIRSMNLRDKFPSAQAARDFGLQVQLQTQTSGDTPLLVVMHAITLWYLGEREEAQRALNGVEKALASTVFRHWPARLREALAQSGLPAKDQAAGP